MVLSNSFIEIFKKNRKCIVNADIDGILAGMLLQNFLNWEVVGYSSCCGKQDDEIWLEDKKENLKECVFVDLPVIVKDYLVVDQHFVGFDSQTIKEYEEHTNKVNPNIMRNRAYINEQKQNEYTKKYPFGTVHFVLAVLENLKIIDSSYEIDFFKKIDSFELADLILRADRVIGNTNQYTNNCNDWADWLISLGGKNTEALFVVVKKEYKKRLQAEKNVESKLLSYGCKGVDGDCSNLFRSKDYTKLINYFAFLSDALDIKPLPMYRVFDYAKLDGKRFNIDNYDVSVAKKEVKKENVFSYAFVSMRVLSATFIKED
jgi:hypothetical protein